MPEIQKPHTLITVDPELHRKLKVRCAQLSVPMKSVVDDLIANFLDGDAICTIVAKIRGEQDAATDQ